ncbi:hypothetical protein GCM10011579_089640 [Streptomyces albiflavescens]|uniref:Uncharacterized protein n=1 Tax=Streptomyces albiflavescens TaxID=1623582 RepID=A0A917YG00_9ACTN|nr:hypothetical protein GCM10011579_089640 [Streptomyces albiflavescens]
MTACATEPMAENEDESHDARHEANDDLNDWTARPACVITADGTYAARLTLAGDSWYPERWTLDGPEPYAVPLPAHQPEEPGTEVQPLTDGRVLIHRVTDGRHVFSLLYPTGPGTGELPLGAVECPHEGTRLRLLPPAPGGQRAYALAVGRGSTAVWLVAGGAFGPEHLAQVPGHCSGGVWLDGTGRLLALDRYQNGRTKTVVVDLERGGEMSPFLQIAEQSNDRLLLADADSGLLLIRSDAPSPGHERLGWGVVGSTLPIRFPECLRLTDCAVTPFAIQPGQMLTPETCAVALRIDGPAGTWLGIWRPAERHVHHLPAPEGWLAGTGLWTREGVLQLPYATGAVPCGVARVEAPTGVEERGLDRDAGQGPESRPPARPVPLQYAPLTGRVVRLKGREPQPGRFIRVPQARPALEDQAAHHTTPIPTPIPGDTLHPVRRPLARPAFQDEALKADSGGLGAAASWSDGGLPGSSGAESLGEVRGREGDESSPTDSPAMTAS